MINESKYKDVLDKGLCLDHYLVLLNLKEGKKNVDSKRIQGFINLLVKKEYIKDEALTEKAYELLEETIVIKTVADKNNLQWAVDMHKRCEEKLVDLTGLKQHKAVISGKAYPFLPNSVDLSKKLMSAIKAYQIKDLDKVEKVLLGYIQKCFDSDNWFPLLQYFIMKDGSSPMMTAMGEDSDEDTTTQYESTQKFV